MNRNLIVVVGPTAVGKTAYTINLAKELDGEIISADSMQIYRYMDIGSAKPTVAERSAIIHHLVDEVDPRLPFSVAQYQGMAKAAIEDVFSRGKQPIVSGGTGLYINSLLYNMDFSVYEGNPELRIRLEEEATAFGYDRVHNRLKALDKESAERIHPNNLKKVIRAIEVLESVGQGIPEFSRSFEKTSDYHWTLIGLTRQRTSLYERIDLRVESLMRMGLVDEVKALLALGLSEEHISMKGIGYKEVISFLHEEYDLHQTVEMIQRNTRRYAKRQMTWFRRFPEICWFDLTELEDQGVAMSEILSYIKSKGFDSKE